MLFHTTITICGLLILFAIYDGAQDYKKSQKPNVTKSSQYKPKAVYYFWSGSEYVQADSQKFRILFTGEVVNAYFIVGNREYSTLNYYKEIK